MSDPLIQHAFIAGELSPKLHGRSDLEKYDLGLALCKNFFVDYRGGISTRSGTKFIDYLDEDDKDIRLFKFAFSPDTANTYLLVLGHQYMRFVQDGGYVLEAATTITGITQANPGVVTTSAPHGYTAGDWVYISSVAGMTEVNDKVYELGAVTATTFELRDVYASNVDTSGFTAYSSGGTGQRVYTVTTPWASTDLARLSGAQRRDEMVFTHVDYAPRKLVRTAATSWTLSTIDFDGRTAAPTNVALTPSSAGTAGMVFAVTAVKNGEESPATRVIEEASVDYTSTAGSMLVEWDTQDVEYFNVYRSLILPTGTEITLANELGYVGRALGPQFTDNNIIPDFTRSPPEFGNPFADGAITSITITAVGTGYAKTDTVSVSGGGGSGFAGFPVVNNAGEIIAVVITNPGSGYSSPTVSFATSGGSGATATATVGPASDNFPAVSRIFQQRRVYAGTENEPMTIWGSKVNDFDNFDVSASTIADDSYEFTIDAELVAPIRHLVPMQGGMVIMSEGGVWQLKGEEGKAVNPTNALADPQSYNGCSFVPPITIDTDILYTQEKGAIVRALSYNDFSQVFAGIDVSTLSNHFFKQGKEIVRWSYAEEPFKLVWGVRANGGMLSFTYVKEQEVFAWAQHWTKGLVKDVQVIEEDNFDYPYLVVERYVNGRWTKYLERLEKRDQVHVEEFWCVDAGLQTSRTYPAATLTPAAATGTGINFAASAAVFAAGDVGKIIRAGGGKAEVTAFVDTTNVTCTWKRDMTDVLPEDSGNRPLPILANAWSMDADVSAISGLDHLEGETVSILADGNVQPSKTVTNGAITLTTPASLITVGLPFTAEAQTLPATAKGAVIEGKRKRVVGVTIRLDESRGLKIGRDSTSVYEMKDRTTEDWGEPTELRSDASYFQFEPAFAADGSVWMQQDYPLPATILGTVGDFEIGDEDA